jgi:hypothetical protein
MENDWATAVPEEMRLECERLYAALTWLRNKPNKSYQDRQLLRALGREHHLILLTVQSMVTKQVLPTEPGDNEKRIQRQGQEIRFAN